MAKRLNSLVYLHQKTSGSFSFSSLLFAPHIETMEDLSSLTEFLVKLGKDIDIKESGSSTTELPHDLDPCRKFDFGGTAGTSASFFLHPKSVPSRVSGVDLHESLHQSPRAAPLKSPHSLPPLSALNLSLLLKDGDAQYKLPPLTGNSSDENMKKLPGIHEVTSRIRNEETRRSHARIISAILTVLNDEVMRRHGRTPSKPSSRGYM
ncbi:hypothetical protein BDZ89DRAFT_215878 [Hymenopellis radicata]|nr:hypothetical protein BDZ89DRAFT_215878 [Hymenopellis radicata]